MVAQGHQFMNHGDDTIILDEGCTVEIHGQYGPVPQWHGVFADKDDFYSHLRKAGFYSIVRPMKSETLKF